MQQFSLMKKCIAYKATTKYHGIILWVENLAHHKSFLHPFQHAQSSLGIPAVGVTFEFNNIISLSIVHPQMFLGLLSFFGISKVLSYHPKHHGCQRSKISHIIDLVQGLQLISFSFINCSLGKVDQESSQSHLLLILKS